MNIKNFFKKLNNFNLLDYSIRSKITKLEGNIKIDEDMINHYLNECLHMQTIIADYKNRIEFCKNKIDINKKYIEDLKKVL